MRLFKTLITTLFLSTLAFGSANALSVEDLLSSPMIKVVVKDGVANLFGMVDTEIDAMHAEYAAAQIEGVKSVNNNLLYSVR